MLYTLRVTYEGAPQEAHRGLTADAAHGGMTSLLRNMLNPEGIGIEKLSIEAEGRAEASPR